MGLVSCTVPRMEKTTFNTMLTSEFVVYLLILMSFYPPRFSDWDLLMHYHWELGVGHIHAYQSAYTSGCISNLAGDAQDIDMELLEAP